MRALIVHAEGLFGAHHRSILILIEGLPWIKIPWTHADKRRAGKLYMDMTKEKKLSEDDVVAIISAPGFDFTKVPKKTFKFAEFMHRIGALKTKPESWKDLYFAEAHSLAGD